MFSNNVDVNQINNVFNNLNTINTSKIENFSLATSKNSVEVRDKNVSIMEKVANYVSDCWYGRREDVSSLSSLTGRISHLVKQQQVNVNLLQLEKINGAVQGLKKFSAQFAEDTREKQQVQKAIKDLVYVSDEVKRSRYLKDLFPGQMNDNQNSIKKAVKKLIVNQSLTEKRMVNDAHLGNVNLPSQFADDCERFSRIALNGEVIFKQPPREQPRFYSAIEQVKRYFQPVPTAAEVGQTLNEKLGSQVFDRLGALQTQSYISDRVVKMVTKNTNMEVLQKVPGFHITQGGSYDFNIKSSDNQLEVDGKIALKVNYLDPEDNNALKTLGYIGMRRIVSTPTNELVQNLEAQSINQRLPNLQVRDVTSPISWDKESAMAAVEAF